jgi:hypothetical protein
MNAVFFCEFHFLFCVAVLWLCSVLVVLLVYFGCALGCALRLFCWFGLTRFSLWFGLTRFSL